MKKCDSVNYNTEHHLYILDVQIIKNTTFNIVNK